MHDAPPPLSDYEFEFESEPEFDEYENESADIYSSEMVAEQPFDESQEMELAAELLEVTDEAELDQFLGNLMHRAAQAAGTFMKSQTGRALGGILKGAARKALPHLGRSIGGYFGGSRGGDIGARLAGSAGHTFGLELEGLSPEDQEYELARRFVRFAGNAAQNAAVTQSAPPVKAAQNAAVTAAQHHAPGLIGRVTLYSSRPTGGSQGRWVRCGHKIILLNI